VSVSVSVSVRVWGRPAYPTAGRSGPCRQSPPAGSLYSREPAATSRSPSSPRSASASPDPSRSPTCICASQKVLLANDCEMGGRAQRLIQQSGYSEPMKKRLWSTESQGNFAWREEVRNLAEVSGSCATISFTDCSATSGLHAPSERTKHSARRGEAEGEAVATPHTEQGSRAHSGSSWRCCSARGRGRSCSSPSRR
jgi:hypothetical protein